MKNLNQSILVFGILIFCSALIAQSERTINGQVWKRIKKENKLYFVTGYVNGLEKAENIIDINVKVQEKNEFAYTEPYYVHRMRESIREYLPMRKNRVPYIIELIDIFYSDADNLKIPFEVALRIALAKDARKYEKSDLWLKEARRKFGQ